METLTNAKFSTKTRQYQFHVETVNYCKNSKNKPSTNKLYKYRQPCHAAQPAWQLMIQHIHKTGLSVNRIACYLSLSNATTYRLIAGSIKKPSNRAFLQILGLYCSIFCLPHINKQGNVVKH